MSAVDFTALSKRLQKAAQAEKVIMPQAYQYFKSITPIKTGNARNNTSLHDNVITANYQYASKLDAGSSKQAPSGMTGPTKTKIAQLLQAFYKSIGK